MAVGHLFASLILLLISNTGSSAEDTVYVETGASVQLDIQRDKLPAEFDELFWEKDKSNTLVKYYNGFKQVKHFKFYEGRVYFNNKTFCVILKNMQKNDSGVYTAMITGDKNGDIAAHTVSVIDKVEAPLLTIIPYQLSSDSCTGNITCKGHNLTITSTYYNGSCSPGNGTSHEKYTIILICSGKNIICNNSNPVSWEKYETNITRLCEDRDDPKKHEAHTNHLNLVIGCVVGGVVIMAGFALVAHCCWKRYKEPKHLMSISRSSLILSRSSLVLSCWKSTTWCSGRSLPAATFPWVSRQFRKCLSNSSFFLKEQISPAWHVPLFSWERRAH
ncbi:natural killer cell receptor 2B4-like isoform X2 [Triplophysa rosa]|uniref:natural killer cell receptor 2B4-like isoform X2 n=1 Tax=Triplophysa rosa TaxID=992332 RepID=UPI00254608CC|nr:natural killer cell receptor 2B4-like isoform X2 [Triplophysa rosa]